MTSSQVGVPIRGRPIIVPRAAPGEPARAAASSILAQVAAGEGEEYVVEGSAVGGEGGQLPALRGHQGEEGREGEVRLVHGEKDAVAAAAGARDAGGERRAVVA